MRLSLSGSNPAEWLALRTGLVPNAAAEAWGGMGLSGMLVAAVRTGLVARLAAAPATATQLAHDLGLDPVPTRLLLACLHSSGHVIHRGGTYRLSRASRRWLDPASRLSVAAFVASTHDYWSWWSDLDRVVRDGQPVAHHAFPPDDPYWERYVRGQLDLARLSAGEVARALPVSSHARSVLDIGGGHGWYAAQLCRRHRRLHATVLDLPGSAAVGRRIIADAGMSDRVEHRDGDAIRDDLGGPYDVVLCFNVVHHLETAQIVDLFRKVGRSLAPDGIFAVMDAFAEPHRRASAAANFLGLFMYLSSGSQVHTPTELRGWFREAGFAEPRRKRILRIPGQAVYVAGRHVL